MRPFVLIDLWSQANYLPREVRSWPWERFVCWLELFGQVDRVEAPAVDDAFYFISAAGPSATFHFSERDGLVLVGDHFVWRIWLPQPTGWHGCKQELSDK